MTGQTKFPPDPPEDAKVVINREVVTASVTHGRRVVHVVREGDNVTIRNGNDSTQMTTWMAYGLAYALCEVVA